MKIKQISIQDFRGIDSLNLTLNGNNAIFFGVNGIGKSTVLRAVDLLFANIIWKITNSKKLADLDIHDIRSGRARAEIKMVVTLSDNEMVYSRSISKENERKNNLRELSQLVECFKENYIVEPYEDNNGNWIVLEDKKNMPIFANYGVNRIASDVKIESKNKIYNKLNAFDKAIEYKLDFNELFIWLKNREDIENQKKINDNINYQDIGLNAVKKAMFAMLDYMGNTMEIDRETMSLLVTKGDEKIDFNCLSDGEKCIMALFGDIARRLVLANPGMPNPLNGSGIVSIDEIDLHIHPQWQRKIIPTLQRVFPEIQFIITTHSPQVLYSVDSTFSIFTMKKEASAIVAERVNRMDGFDSNYILEEYMDTESRNDIISITLDGIYNLIKRKEYFEAEKELDKLKLIQGPNKQEYITAMDYYNRKRMLDEADNQRK